MIVIEQVFCSFFARGSHLISTLRGSTFAINEFWCRVGGGTEFCASCPYAAATSKKQLLSVRSLFGFRLGESSYVERLSQTVIFCDRRFI